MGEFAIGQPVPRFEDPRLVKGGGRYVADMVFPGTAFGYVLRSPHAHARIRSIDTAQAKAAPGVLAVLTGADYKAAGFGDLPVPGGLKRRDGVPGYRPRYPALVEDRVRMIGDYVAFVIAETYYQAVDASELIEVDYEPLPAIVATGDAVDPDAPLVWDDCPNNVGFVQIEGDKAATDAAFAKAAHVVKHHFVINRVTAAAMEPRGCIGLFEPIEGRYTIYTTLQRTNVFQTELSQYVLKVPDSKIRVVCGDIGGSFGMKSAVYNEVALVLLGAKLLGRPVKWVATRSESFLCDAQARDNVTDAELALDKDGNFLGFRAKIIAAIGAYLQVGMPAFTGNLGSLAGVYRTPASHVDVSAVFTNTQPLRPYRGNGRPEAGYIIERMVDIAADQIGMDAAELRRRNTIAPDAMPFKTSVTFTYDCGEFEKNMNMALDAADQRGFEARRAEARKNGKLRGLGSPTPSSVRLPPVSKAPRSGLTAAARSRSSPAASIRARATRPRSSKSFATASVSIPMKSLTSRATPIRCFSPKAPAARARQLFRDRPSRSPRKRSRLKARRSPQKCSASRSAISISMKACFPARKPIAP